MKRRHKLLVPLLLMAFGLRIWGIADHNIWWDEGIGVWLARMPVLESVRWTAGDVHPPLYYIALRGWRGVTGEGIYTLRFLSALFSLLTVPLAYRLGRSLDGESTGLLTALLLALSRFAIWWAQEIRMYALAAMLATGSLWAAVWLWRESHQPQKSAPSSDTGAATGAGVGANTGQRHRLWAAWGLYVLTTVGSLFTLYLAVTVPVVTNVGFAALWWRHRSGKKRRDLRLGPWVSAQCAIAGLFLPWLIYALPRMHGWSSDAPFTPRFFLHLYTTMLAVGSPIDLETYLPLVAAVFVGLGVGLAGLWSRAQTGVRFGGLTMLLAGLLLPPAVVTLISLPALQFHFARPLAPRYLLPLAACYSALLAWSILAVWRAGRSSAGLVSRTGRKSVALAMAGMALAAALTGLVGYLPGRARHDDFTTIGEVLRALRRPEDAVVLYVDRDWPIFTAHYAGARHDLAYGANFSDRATVDARLGELWEQSRGVWLVSTPESLQADPQQSVPQWLRARAAVSETLVRGDNSLTFYARTPERALLRATVTPGFEAPAQIGAPFGLAGASIPLERYRTGDTLHLGLYWVPPVPSDAQVQLQGEGVNRVYDVPLAPAEQNLARGQVDIPLTPDLPGGDYQIEVAVPGFEAAVAGEFELVQATAGTDATPASIPHPTDHIFGPTPSGATIRLIGYALPQTRVAAGEAIPLTLYWESNATLSTRYKIFTHLLGDTFNAETDNFLWGQQDNEPVNGQAPTTVWAPGTTIADPYRIEVAPHAPPGSYRIEVGLYGLLDGARLPLVGNGDAVVIGRVDVVGREGESGQ